MKTTLTISRTDRNDGTTSELIVWPDSPEVRRLAAYSGRGTKPDDIFARLSRGELVETCAAIYERKPCTPNR